MFSHPTTRWWSRKFGSHKTYPEQLLGALGNCLAVGYAANATGAGITINDLSVDLQGDLDLHTFLGLNPEPARRLEWQVSSLAVNEDRP